MVLLTLSQKFNQWLGPFLLRNGVRCRFWLGGGVIRDQTAIDAALLLPVALKLMSLEVHEQSKAALKLETSKDPSKLRVSLLESYLRPALLPNERWSDVRLWQFHHRIVKWARTETLLAKYQDELRLTMDAFPALRRSPQLSWRRRKSPVASLLTTGKLPVDDVERSDNKNDHALARLPPCLLVTQAFGLERWSQNKNLRATGREMARIAKQLGGQLVELRGGALRFADVPPDADLSGLPLEDILEAAGGHILNCGTFNTLCEEAGVFQLWTRE